MTSTFEEPKTLRHARELAVESEPANKTDDRPPWSVSVTDTRWLTADPKRPSRYEPQVPKLHIDLELTDADRALDAEARRLIAMKGENNPATVAANHRRETAVLYAQGAALSREQLNRLETDREQRIADGIERERIAREALACLVEKQIKPRGVQLLREQVLPAYGRALEKVSAMERGIAADIGIAYDLPSSAERALFFALERLRSFIDGGLGHTGGELTLTGILSEFVRLDP